MMQQTPPHYYGLNLIGMHFVRGGDLLGLHFARCQLKSSEGFAGLIFFLFWKKLAEFLPPGPKDRWEACACVRERESECELQI